MANDSIDNESSTVAFGSQDESALHPFETDLVDLRKRIILLEAEKEKLQHLVCYLLKKNEDLRRKLHHNYPWQDGNG